MLFGIITLAVRAQVGAIYGSHTDPNGLLWARYDGAAILFPGVIAWLARRAPTVEVLRAVLGALTGLFTVNLAVSVHALLAELVNALHWTTIAFELLLSGVFGLYALRIQGASGQPVDSERGRSRVRT